MIKKGILFLLLSMVFIFFIVFFGIKNDKQEVVTNTPPSTISDILEQIENTQNHIGISEWNTYTSPVFGISFQYPKTTFVFEGEMYERHYIAIYPDTELYHSFVENPDSIEAPTGGIGISMEPLISGLVPSEFIKKYEDTVQWKETTLFGDSAVAYTGFSLDYFDGVAVEHDSALYNFTVSYLPNSEVDMREEFYSMVSTIEFLKL